MKKFLIVLSLLILGLTYVVADNSRYNNDNSYEKRDKYKKMKLSNNQLYTDECGSCHMAYQAELLPRRSWDKMMNELENHFGVDATLNKDDELAIRLYLNTNNSDSKRVYGEIRELSDSIHRDSIPIAISSLPKFKDEHDEIPKKLIVQKEVKQLSNCNACHLDAKDGLYKERNILIPNFGRWDD